MRALLLEFGACARRRPGPRPHPGNSLADIGWRGDAAPRQRWPSPSRAGATRCSAGRRRRPVPPARRNRDRARETSPCAGSEPSLLRTMPSSTRAAQGRKSARCDIGSTIFGEVHHARASNGEMAGDAQMPAHHVDELRIALRGPDRGGLADEPRARDRRATAAGRDRAPPPSVPLRIATARGAPPSRMGSVSAR